MTVVKDFLRAFWRAMGDRENHLVAYRELGIMLLVCGYVLGVVALAQVLGPR